MEMKIRHTWFFPHPAATVWEYLTDPALLSQWLMQNDFKPEVGHKFRFQTKPRPNPRFDGNIYCEVLEITPLKKLVYSWKGGPEAGSITLDSTVTWTLNEKPGGTELRLEHSGFRGMGNFVAYLVMNAGWNKMVKKRLFQKIDVNENETAPR